MAKQATVKASPTTQADLFLAFINGEVDTLGGKQITGEEVAFHDEAKIILPRGMTFEQAYKVFERLEEEAEMPTTFDRTFRYRADDGAYATIQVIKEMFGMALGKQWSHPFFGVQPAETRTIAIGVGQTMQVPWGLIEIPIFPGLEFRLCDQHADRDYGKIFEIHAVGPRKYKDQIEALFDAIAEYLATKSIYRGHALTGANDPEFLDLSSFDSSQIVFSEDVVHMLEGSIWAPIRHTAAMRENGVPLKRATLLYGPYGTGKSSTGQLTAELATQHGWTFFSARPGRDNVDDVLRTAKLYQPAVVFIEDIDTVTSSGDADEVSAFLDAFDGITAKGGELIAIMTTNHIEKIHRGMLRPGRLDAVIEIAGLDSAGIEKLIKAVVPDTKLSRDVDYAAVAQAMDGFYPAFVRESITRAVTFAISRLNGQSNYVIDTPDLVDAAKSLLPQLAALEGAGEGQVRPPLENAFSEIVKGAFEKMGIRYNDRETWKVVEIDA